MNTDQIDRVNLDDLKKATEGEASIGRIKYRKQVNNFISGKRKEIAKGEIVRKENAHAEGLEEKDKNEDFGFSCLHYSVSEAAGKLKVKILNKKGKSTTVRVKTVDAEAIGGKAYYEFNEDLNFADGEKYKFVEIGIVDDDEW